MRKNNIALFVLGFALCGCWITTLADDPSKLSTKEDDEASRLQILRKGLFFSFVLCRVYSLDIDTSTTIVEKETEEELANIKSGNSKSKLNLIQSLPSIFSTETELQ